MNILKKEYAACWELNKNFKLVCIEENDIIEKIVSIKSVCLFLACNLNFDCKIYGQPIDDFVLNYLVVDSDKEVFNVCFRHKGDDVIIYLESRGETIVTFNMSEYIDADERYY